jgi:ribosome-associated translation inhibitor RaiA
MKIEIVGRNLHVEDSLRSLIERKAKKLERLRYESEVR